MCNFHEDAVRFDVSCDYLELIYNLKQTSTITKRQRQMNERRAK